MDQPMLDTHQIPRGRNLHFLQVGKDPVQGLLGCGFIEKNSITDHYYQVRFPHFGVVWLLRGEGIYTDSRGVSYLLEPGSAFCRIPGELHSQTLDPDSHWLEAFIAFGTPMYRGLDALGQIPLDQRVFHPGLSQLLLNDWITTYQEFLHYDTFNPENPAQRRKPDLQTPNVSSPGTGGLLMMCLELCTRLMAMESTKESTGQIPTPWYSINPSASHQLQFQAEIWREPFRLDSQKPGFNQRGVNQNAQATVQQAKTLLGSPEMPSPKEVAETLFLGYSTLRKLFFQETGESMVGFRLKLRMNKAAELLSNTNKPVKEIAKILGYQSSGAFTQQFKAVKGVLPGEYRREHQVINT